MKASVVGWWFILGALCEAFVVGVLMDVLGRDETVDLVRRCWLPFGGPASILVYFLHYGAILAVWKIIVAKKL